ncbi:hypothetical protein BH10ACT3_BH10ACT3_08880 [soil metagenome]
MNHGTPNRTRSRLVLTAASALLLTSALVAQTAAAADTTTTSTTPTSTSTSSTTTTTSATSTTSTTSSTDTTTSTSTTSTPPSSSAPGTSSPGSTAPDLSSSIPVITAAASALPLFIAAGTPSQSPAGSAIEINDYSAVSEYVADPSPELTSTFENFFDQGGVTAYLWLTPDEQAATLLSAIGQIAQSNTPATIFVIPALSTLDGQDYLDVATSLAALADGTLGMALLDTPATVVAAVKAAWPDVSAFTALVAQLRTSITAKGATAPNSAALYAAPLIDPSSGDTVPAAVVMAGIVVRQDLEVGPWAAPAGGSVPVLGLNVSLPFTNAQQGALGSGINVFRSFPNYGTVMWGARTLSTGEEYEYISVSRTADWIERSMSSGLAWTVFQPNNPATQDLVNRTVSAFLATAWEQ